MCLVIGSTLFDCPCSLRHRSISLSSHFSHVRGNALKLLKRLLKFVDRRDALHHLFVEITVILRRLVALAYTCDPVGSGSGPRRGNSGDANGAGWGADGGMPVRWRGNNGGAETVREAEGLRMEGSRYVVVAGSVEVAFCIKASTCLAVTANVPA